MTSEHHKMLFQCCCFCLFSLHCAIVILSRLERLQRIFTKVQMESGLCDEHLSHLDGLLQKVCVFYNLVGGEKKKQ